MEATLEVESTLTDRYQTTVPETVRLALGLRKRDKVHYTIRPNGEVVLSRADTSREGDDPVLESFLAFLARDDTFAALKRVVVDVGDIDLDAPLSPDDE
jgi:antitoxin PrlF